MIEDGLLDEDLTALLLASVRRIDGWMKLFQEGVQAPQPGSSLSGDDRAAAPYQVSHRAFMALSHATDSMHMLRRAALTGEGEALHLATRPYGAFPLLRAGLEGATLALWLLGPSNRVERVRRRMVMHVVDARNEDQAVVNFRGSQELERSPRAPVATAQAVEVLRPLMVDVAAQQWSVKQWKIVAGGAAYARGGEHLLGWWNVLSAAAHGEWWAALSLSERELMGEDGDVRTVRLTSPARTTVVLTSIVTRALDDAWSLYGARAANHLDG